MQGDFKNLRMQKQHILCTGEKIEVQTPNSSTGSGESLYDYVGVMSSLRVHVFKEKH